MIESQASIEPVVAVLPDASVHIGQGYTIGDVLQALDVARQAVLSIVPNRPAIQGPNPAEAATP